MKLHLFEQPPPMKIGIALEKFEAHFRYPLGPKETFSISHGRKYTPFFQAIGETRLVVAENEGQILATLAGAIQQVDISEGETCEVGYLGDLKSRDETSPFVLARLLQCMHSNLAVRVERAYGVVMDGTKKLPNAYTGRLGVPQFNELGKLSILRVDASQNRSEELLTLPLNEWKSIHQLLSRYGVLPEKGDSTLRSNLPVEYLTSANGLACGCLEDTTLAKRLILSSGKEMRTAHLSRFTYEDADSAAQLLRAVSNRCSELGYSAFFTSIPSSLEKEILSIRDLPETTLAPATVFGCGDWDLNKDWFIDSAAI